MLINIAAGIFIAFVCITILPFVMYFALMGIPAGILYLMLLPDYGQAVAGVIAGISYIFFLWLGGHHHG